MWISVFSDVVCQAKFKKYVHLLKITSILYLLHIKKKLLTFYNDYTWISITGGKHNIANITKGYGIEKKKTLPVTDGTSSVTDVTSTVTDVA